MEQPAKSQPAAELQPRLSRRALSGGLLSATSIPKVLPSGVGSDGSTSSSPAPALRRRGGARFLDLIDVRPLSARSHARAVSGPYVHIVPHPSQELRHLKSLRQAEAVHYSLPDRSAAFDRFASRAKEAYCELRDCSWGGDSRQLRLVKRDLVAPESFLPLLL